MLKSLFQDSAANIDLSSILICTLVSIILGVVISFVHKRTSKYSKNFLITLAILPVLVQTVIIMVNGNLGASVAIFGAFSLVRFRSVPGTSKEILSVFFAMAIGLATGMGHAYFAILMTIIISISILLFNRIKLFSEDVNTKILKIVVPEDLDYTSMFDKTFKKYLSDYSLESVKLINMGSLFELKYRVTFKFKMNEKSFIDEVRVKNCNLKIILSNELVGSEL